MRHSLCAVLARFLQIPLVVRKFVILGALPHHFETLRSEYPVMLWVRIYGSVITCGKNEVFTPIRLNVFEKGAGARRKTRQKLAVGYRAFVYRFTGIPLSSPKPARS